MKIRIFFLIANWLLFMSLAFAGDFSGLPKDFYVFEKKSKRMGPRAGILRELYYQEADKVKKLQTASDVETPEVGLGIDAEKGHEKAPSNLEDYAAKDH